MEEKKGVRERGKNRQTGYKVDCGYATQISVKYNNRFALFFC